MKIEKVKCPECCEMEYIAVPLGGDIRAVEFVCCRCRCLWEMPDEQFEEASLKGIAREEGAVQKCPKCCHIGGYGTPIVDGLCGARIECAKCGCRWIMMP